jgi:hypothetical protein
VRHQLGWLGPLLGRRSSGRPDLLLGDGRELGRWGPKGTHVSQAPERGVGVATLEGHGEVIEQLTGRIACTSVKKKNEQISLAADLV